MENLPDPRRVVAADLWPGRRAAAWLGVLVLLATALPLVGPLLTRRFVDGAIAGDSTELLVLVAVVYLAVVVAAQGARMATAWMASRLAWKGTNRLRERLAEHALSLDMSFHGRHRAGEMIERVDGDVVALAEFVTVLLLDVVVSALLLVGVLIVTIVVDWRIGIVLLAFTVLATVIIVRLQRLAVPAATTARESIAALFGNVEERLVAAEDLRANGAGRHAVRRFEQASGVTYRADLRAERMGGGVFAATNLAFAIGTALVLGLAAALQRSGVVTVGTAVLLFQYTQMVRRPIERLIDQMQEYQKALAGVARIGQLLAERSELTPPPLGGRPLPAGPLDLRFEGVDFAYADDNETVLADVHLDVGAGRSLGLVGRTGSGKTTLARLALRLYDPTEGVVRIAGVDLREVATQSLRRRVAIVTQDVQIFSASVRDNVTMFRGHVSDDRVIDVLVDLGLGPWLATLPGGLDTELGAGGAGLSAGEAQLLAFSRAFLDDPGLVVLDEASSRLDPGTEAVIERAIGRLLADRTAVIIAHRLSSLSRVDEIAVIEDGWVVEHGERADLAADSGSRFAGLLRTAGVRM